MTKMRHLLLIFTAILLSNTGSIKAQTNNLTLQDLTPGGKTYFKYTPTSVRQLKWLGDRYIFAKGDSLYIADPGKTEQVALTVKELSDLLVANNLPSLASLPNFIVPEAAKPIVVFTYKRTRVHLDLTDKTIVNSYQLPTDGANYLYAAGSGSYAYTSGNNVRILTAEGDILNVTNETEPGIVCGQAVHQREFGIENGLFWSPSGKKLAFYRMDERMVAEYPIVNIDKRIATAEPFHYPMAGEKSHEVTLGVYDVETGETTWMNTGLPKEKFLTNIAWSPDSKTVYIAEINRGQNNCQLVTYNASTGEQQAVLFTEANERYVEPQVPVTFVPNHDNLFIWQSRKDGYNHVYLYDTTGKQIRQLTQGKWEVANVLGFDAKGEQLFVSGDVPAPLSAKEEGNPLEVYTQVVQIKNGKTSFISDIQAVHNTTISASGKYAIATYSSPSIPRNIDLIRVKDKKVLKNLHTAPNPYKSITMPTVTTGTLKSADGNTDLYYRLTVPADLDETKKYPVIVYVYGGPHSQLVTGGWMNGASGWDLYMANQGYILFTLDNRGTNNRGFEFESIIHRNLGVHEMADQMKGVEFLKSLPYTDHDRFGVYGWSYGGFMTTNLMLTHSDVFKVGVAGGPVIDWAYYEIMYGERYMDTPQENPEGYKNANLKLRAGDLKGRLLQIHGDVDNVVLWQHSLSFIKACVDAGTHPDYFVYPRHQHNVIGKDRPHLMEHITRYFADHL